MRVVEAQREGYSPHSVRLAWILALAYLLVIVHASLQPYHGWRMPPDEILRFLVAPWPHYITFGDIIVNFGAYIPFGFLLSIGWGARHGTWQGVFYAVLCATGLSLAMESAQMFLPARIASNVDLLANGVGALLGAMSAPLFAPTQILGGKLHAVRHRLFVDGMAADVSLVIVCLWLITQFHPITQLFGTGSLRVTFDLPVVFTHTPQFALSAEAAVVLFNLLGVGLMMSAFMRSAARPMLAAGALIAAALLIKTVTAAMLVKAAALFAWLTPGVTLGLLSGWALLYGAVRLPRTAKLAVAALSIALATAVINIAPGNPYQSVPPQLIAGGASHFMSFTGIVRALSELWPLLAAGFLAWALGARRNPI